MPFDPHDGSVAQRSFEALHPGFRHGALAIIADDRARQPGDNLASASSSAASTRRSPERGRSKSIRTRRWPAWTRSLRGVDQSSASIRPSLTCRRRRAGPGIVPGFAFPDDRDENRLAAERLEVAHDVTRAPR